MDTFTLFDDSPATTAPAATEKSAAVKVKTYKIGNHRGNGRIFLEGNLIKSAGFDCGIEYTRVDNVFHSVRLRSSRDAGVITLYAGRVSGIDGLHFPVRRVTQSMRNGKARPIIDLSDTTIRERFAGFSRVEVEFNNGLLVIRGAK